MSRATLRLSVPVLTLTLLACLAMSGAPSVTAPRGGANPNADAAAAEEEAAMRIQYLEIVTPDVEETCAALAEMHGIAFGEPIPEFGNARAAELAGGGRIGVRAPMRDTEEPVVRPYALVEDIGAAVEAAEKAGATIAIPPMPIPGQGTFSIYILGGIEHGLWEL